MTQTELASSEHIAIDFDNFDSVANVALIDVDIDNDEWSFPEMTQFETDVIRERGTRDPEIDTNFTLSHLLQILNRRHREAEGSSFEDKLKSLDLTGSPYENVFGCLLLYNFIRILVKNDMRTNTDLTEEEKQSKYNHIMNKLFETWNKFLDIYTPCGSESHVPLVMRSYQF